MRMVVSHLTRMMKGYICAAGIDLVTREHVRPVLPGMRLRADLLESRGGPIGMAAVLDLGAIRFCGTAPEVEDVEFHPSQLTRLGALEGAEFWELLQSLAEQNLQDVFGDDLQPVGQTFAIQVGGGAASLGYITPQRPPRLAIDRRNRIRALLADGSGFHDLPVTDLRLYENEHQDPREALIERINERMARGVAVIAGVGVTRPFAASDGEPPLHWVQVNNLHLSDDPTWAG